MTHCHTKTNSKRVENLLDVLINECQPSVSKVTKLWGVPHHTKEGGSRQREIGEGNAGNHFNGSISIERAQVTVATDRTRQEERGRGVQKVGIYWTRY